MKIAITILLSLMIFATSCGSSTSEESTVSPSDSSDESGYNLDCNALITVALERLESADIDEFAGVEGWLERIRNAQVAEVYLKLAEMNGCKL